jgi:hypothetical protein
VFQLIWEENHIMTNYLSFLFFTLLSDEGRDPFPLLRTPSLWSNRPEKGIVQNSCQQKWLWVGFWPYLVGWHIVKSLLVYWFWIDPDQLNELS